MGLFSSKKRQRAVRNSAEVAAAMALAIDGEPQQAETRDQDEEELTLRRWDAAKTNRLNKAHWQNATGQPINADLVSDLKTLRARSTHEAANNPLVDGVITTHQTDLVGKHGPRLSVVSDDQQYNDGLEELWNEWWELPDFNGELSGVEMMQMWVHQWWTKGEHLLKRTYHKDADTQIKFRVQNLDPDRLNTSPSSAGNPRVVLGVVRDKHGRPLQYEIAKPPANYLGAIGHEYETFSADEIIHQFKKIDPDQARGFPWIASGLSTIADLRAYDNFELDAAKLAASQGIVWYTEHPDAPYLEVQESVELERNTQSTGPPGWKPMMVDAAHPSQNYTTFRTERLRELGRPVAMPLMKILLGSERHNFASARMDNQNYWLALQMLQGWTERTTLNVLLNAIAREAMLMRQGGKWVLPRRPRRVRYEWTWPRQPHVNPVQEATADNIRLKNGTLAYRDALAKEGREEDAVIASRQATEEKLEEAGLPSVSDSTNSQKTPANQPSRKEARHAEPACTT